MNREIKFRGWDIDGYTNQYKMFYEVTDIKGLESRLMQYTGLKDSLGKEVYEGDILKNTYGHFYRVEFENDGWKYLTGDSGAPLYQSTLRYLEVAGNIYETPELVKLEQTPSP